MLSIMQRRLSVLRHTFKNHWQSMRPLLTPLANLVTVIFSCISLIRAILPFVPVVLSALTVIASVPVLNFFLPNFLLTKSAIISVLLGLTMYAGYIRYKELVERNRLDQQIVNNTILINESKQCQQALTLELKQIKACQQTLIDKINQLEKQLIFRQLNNSQLIDENQSIDASLTVRY